jgi:Nif-specific regulatory protein
MRIAGDDAVEVTQEVEHWITRNLDADYPWPGNIRELENAIERAVVLGASDVILPEDLPDTLFEATSTTANAAIPNFHAAVAEHKRELILRAVHEARGNLSEAARLLGLHPNYLHRLITAMELRSKLATPAR